MKWKPLSASRTAEQRGQHFGRAHQCIDASQIGTSILE
jgi:hypothetical protein